MGYEGEAKYLREELNRLYDDQRQATDEKWELKKKRRRQREQEWAEEQCYADSWDEAFPKAIRRYMAEARDEKHLREEEHASVSQLDYLFCEWAIQHTFAHEAWKIEQVKIADRVARIRERAERMIAALEQAARDRVADQVEEAFGDVSLADNLREDDYLSLVNW